MSHQDYILKMLGLEDKNIIFSEIINCNFKCQYL